MKQLQGKLEAWLDAKLITPQQYQAILSYEAQTHNVSDNKPWLFYGLLVLGASIIGIGLISLIAANWSTIPDTFKLMFDFLCLVSLAVIIFRVYQIPSSMGFETLVIIFLLLCLASIGLIAQIFHTSGQWYHALLFWAAISLPLALYSQRSFTPFLWSTLFLAAAIWSLHEFIAHVYQQHYDFAQHFVSTALLAPLLSATLMSFIARFKNLHYFNVSFHFWFLLTAILALITADLLHSVGEHELFTTALYVPAWGIAGLLSLGIALRQDYPLLNKLLLICILILLLLFYHPDLLFTGQMLYMESYYGAQTEYTANLFLADDIRAPFLSLLILFLYAFHAGTLGRKTIFNLLTFLIGLRFLVLYFQALGGLAATGIGLIISGTLIITIVYFWYRGKERLQTWVQGFQPKT